MDTEKTSYTLKHPEEEKDESKTESYEPLDEDAGETDKMLSKPTADEVKPVEETPEVNETTALEEKKEAIKDDGAQGSTPSVPFKNRFLQLFERKKSANEPPSAAQNGNPVDQSVTDGDGTNPPTSTETQPPGAAKRRFIPLKLQNPFAKKSDNVTPTPEKPTATEASSSDEKKGKSVQKSCTSIQLCLI